MDDGTPLVAQDITGSRRGSATPEDAAVAEALREVLDAGDRRPADPDRLLTSVRGRALGRRHRRVATASLVSAVAVAGALVAVGSGVPGARSAPPASGGAPATGGAVPLSRDVLLTDAEVAAVIPGSRSFLGGEKYQEDPPSGPPHGVCAAQPLPGVGVPSHDLTSEWSGAWVPTTQTDASGAVEDGGSTQILLVEDVFSWPGATGGTAYASALTTDLRDCASGGPSPSYRLLAPPPSLGGGVLAVDPGGAQGWAVLAVAVHQGTAVLLRAVMPTSGASDGDDAAREVAALAATALDRTRHP